MNYSDLRSFDRTKGQQEYHIYKALEEERKNLDNNCLDPSVRYTEIRVKAILGSIEWYTHY